MSDLPAADWYPAPGDSSQLRYWDGSRWTEHFAPAVPPNAASTEASKSSSRDWWFGRTAKQMERKQRLRSTKQGDKQSGGASGQPTASVDGRPMRPRRQAPAKTPVDAWATTGGVSQDVVGERNYRKAFAALVNESGKKTDSSWGAELTDARAHVVTEPDNRFDPDAVAVLIDGKHLVGYLPRDVSAIYAPYLAALEREQRILRVMARVWIAPPGDDRVGSVTVRLPPPDGISCFNELPDEPHVVLPSGKAVQVTGEELHMDVLRGFALGQAMRHVAATLHTVTKHKARGDVEIVEVRLDGHRVGTLSKAMGDQIKDLVTFVSDRGWLPVARAVIKGSDLRADVTSYVARTVDVTHRWLDSVTSD